MSTSVVRIGIAGCGLAARIHLDRLLALEDVEVIGCADANIENAHALADRASGRRSAASPGKQIQAYADHRELLRVHAPDALMIFTPHLSHYRLAMDALQAGCHVFIEKPMTTNSQEAADIVSLARARSRKVGVGHQFRLSPSLIEARRRVTAGELGAVRLVTAVLARPWLTTLTREESNWRFDPKVAGSGILADAGDHLIDAILWTTGQTAGEVGAIQSQRDGSIDLVTAASIRLLNGSPVSLAVSGIAARAEFALTFYGETGQLHATDHQLFDEKPDGPRCEIAVPAPDQSIDSNFMAAVRGDAPLCCPAEEALESVRLLEAIGRSAATGQFVRLI